jgi:hypothetical protein
MLKTSRKVIPLTLIMLANVAVAKAQGINQVRVSKQTLQQHLYLLASDSLQGRKTGTRGQREAATYCIQDFRKHRLIAVFRTDSNRASFRQTYPFRELAIAPYGMPNQPYSRYELVPPPRTHRDSSRVLLGDNVAGLLVGTDLKQEIVVLSAHYDHLGRPGSRVYHGADDNASGTSAVLAIAATMDSLAQQGIRPRRSVLFVLFSGEEGGLIGSEYFVRNCPFLPAQLVCDLNIDMVGRVDAAHRKQPDYCYLIGGPTSDSLRATAQKANTESVQLELSPTFDSEADPNRYFYRSDHYNFYRIGVPILFFMDGEHPDYHQPTDTADRIDYDLLQKRAMLVFQTAWRMANP